MSETEHGERGAAEPGAGAGVGDEEELRRALEEQMRRAHVGDLVVQSAVGILNLSARRLAIEDERDLDQARLGIDAVRALADLLPAEIAGQVRDALAQLQMQYAQLAGGGGAGAEGDPEAGAGGSGDGGGSGGAEPPKRPSGGAASGLWTPPGSA